MTLQHIPSGRSQPSVRWLGFVLASLAMVAPPVAAAEDGEPRVLVDFGVGRFEGEYGTDDTTSIDVTSVGVRWYVPRGEVRVTAPYYRVTGVGDVSFVGGSSAPGFRGLLPPWIDPPGGPPGGPPDGNGTEEPAEPERQTVSGTGDLFVRGEVYLLEGTATRPWITGLVGVKLPTADENEGLGTGKADYEVGVGAVQPAGRVNLLADAGYTRVGQPDLIELDDIVRLGAGVAVRVGDRPGNNLYTYVENRTSPVPGFEDQRSVSVGGNARFGSDGSFRLVAAVFAGLTEAVEDFGVSVRFGRAF